jgi:hypothetical protein
MYVIADTAAQPDTVTKQNTIADTAAQPDTVTKQNTYLPAHTLHEIQHFTTMDA